VAALHTPAPADTAYAIEARGLEKVYGSGDTAVAALRGVDLLVRDGEMAAIMGPSGSGKSTLLHLVGALETPTAGTIAIAGKRFDGLSDNELTLLRRERIGFVFQFFNLLGSLTAEENVLLPAMIAGRAGESARRRARELLGRVGLSHRRDHLPAQLSGGEQQRVSIARALLLRPALVLGDEPTGNLDSKASEEVLALLSELNVEEGHTIVLVTHESAVADACGRTVQMMDGQVVSD
jgi:putative ABC transport system ATP-binding protein